MFYEYVERVKIERQIKFTFAPLHRVDDSLKTDTILFSAPVQSLVLCAEKSSPTRNGVSYKEMFTFTLLRFRSHSEQPRNKSTVYSRCKKTTLE